MPDYYGGGDDEGAMDGKPTMGASDKDSPKEEEEGTTALLPKSILAGKEFKPGDEVVLKVVHLFDDEVEVSYATEKAGEKEEGSEMSKSMGKMESMGSES